MIRDKEGQEYDKHREEKKGETSNERQDERKVWSGTNKKEHREEKKRDTGAKRRMSEK